MVRADCLRLNDLGLKVKVVVVWVLCLIKCPVSLDSQHDVGITVGRAHSTEDGRAISSIQLVLLDNIAPELKHRAAILVKVGAGGHQRGDTVRVVVESSGTTSEISVDWTGEGSFSTAKLRQYFSAAVRT